MPDDSIVSAIERKIVEHDVSRGNPKGGLDSEKPIGDILADEVDLGLALRLGDGEELGVGLSSWLALGLAWGDGLFLAVGLWAGASGPLAVQPESAARRIWRPHPPASTRSCERLGPGRSRSRRRRTCRPARPASRGKRPPAI